MVAVPSTVGALLIGGLVATAFSAVVIVQSFAYFKFYPTDSPPLRFLVLAVWLLDFCHTLCVCASVWYYLITHYGDAARIDHIPWSLALTIVITAILTFLVHCFFVHRIYKVSKDKWLIAVPLSILACARLCAACITTAKMIILKSFSVFVQKFSWSFTLGLALTSTMDLLITGFLCYFLFKNRKESSSMNHIIDTLMIYTFENCLLTSATTIISMICWLTMPTNLIFMGLHFVICKLYANSLLATLNTRRNLRRRPSPPLLSADERDRPIAFPEELYPARRRSTTDPFSRRLHHACQEMKPKPTTLQVNVEQTIEYNVDEEGSPSVSIVSGTTCTIGFPVIEIIQELGGRR